MGFFGTWGLVEGPLEGSPIGVADDFCPLPCPEVAPELVAPVSPWLGSGSDGSTGVAIGEAPLGCQVDGALLGGHIGPKSWELGGFDLPG